MDSRLIACAVGVALAGLVAGCSSPFETPYEKMSSLSRIAPGGADVPSSRYREPAGDDAAAGPTLDEGSTPDDYVRYALFNSPRVESAYQKWRAASERLPQVSALPDPRLNFGFFLNEVETRVGPQQARVGVSQTLPWMGKRRNREDAASRAAMSAWRDFEAARLSVSEQVVSLLHELAYLDAATRISNEILDLISSFEEVIRARYRVGAGSHPELIRVQVELGMVQDRVAQLRAMRPAFVAELNAALNRESDSEIGPIAALPGRLAAVDPGALGAMARRSNPTLLALDEKIEEQRHLSEVARKDGLPDLTVGLEYIVTDEAMNSSTPESGDDPILLTFGVNVPIWREKYDAGVRETIARRLSISGQRADETNRITAAIQRAWFEHTDADRRVRLYEQTLIPKSRESLRATLTGYRGGDANFLDLLDTERTLLEFAIAAERARADRGMALVRLSTLVGEPVPTTNTDDRSTDQETREVSR